MPNRTDQYMLVIAPESGLDIVPEIDALYALGYNVQLVPNPPTRDRLFAMAQKRQFKIIHFAGHANRDGIDLGLRKDGQMERMDATSLVQLARSAHADLVFLNGCETAELGQILVDEHIPAAICTLAAIDNQVAKETAQLFYQRLAETHDITTAYNTSKPPVKGGYSLFRNGSLTSELLAPVLVQITELAKLMENSTNERVAIVSANDAEHRVMRTDIDYILTACKDQVKQRTWFLKVSVAVVVISLLLQLIITFVGRGL